MARRLKCLRCGSPKYWIVRRERRRCARCRYEWRPARLPLYLSSQQWRTLLGWFVRGVSSAVIAQETGLHRQRVLRALTYVRQAMACDVSPGFQKEVQFNAIYLGAHRERRERGNGLESSSFAIVWDNGSVRIEAVSDAAAESLLPLIPKPARLDSAMNSDPKEGSVQTVRESRQPSLAEHGESLRLPDEESQINRLRGFWGYLKRQLAGKGGIRRERLPLYLAEYIWRFNHRRSSHAQQVQEIMTALKQSLHIIGVNTTLPLVKKFARSRPDGGLTQPDRRSGRN